MTEVFTEPAAGRSCGGCTMCCKVLGITELQKPVGKWCKHCEIGYGCRIYETRPAECRTFHCAWLVDDRFSDIFCFRQWPILDSASGPNSFARIDVMRALNRHRNQADR
jgi:hypothetical protein